MHGCDVLNKRGFDCPYMLSEHTLVVAIERLHMMSQHRNSLATATAAILVRNENLLRLCAKMAAFFMAKGCTQG